MRNKAYWQRHLGPNDLKSTVRDAKVTENSNPLSLVLSFASHSKLWTRRIGWGSQQLPAAHGCPRSGKSEWINRRRLPISFGILIKSKARDKEQYVFLKTNKLVLKEQALFNIY